MGPSSCTSAPILCSMAPAPPAGPIAWTIPSGRCPRTGGRNCSASSNYSRSIPPGWLIVRTAWVYGRHGANFPRTMVTVAPRREAAQCVCDQVGAPTYTVDLAEAILVLVDATPPVSIMSPTPAKRTGAISRATLEAFKINHPVGGITSADWAKIKPNAAHRPSYSVLDLSKYEEATGKKMRMARGR